MDTTTEVKLAIYRTTAATGRVPDARRVALRLKLEIEEVVEAFRDLAAQRLLVLEPSTPKRIRMAPPFSGIRTPFQVRVGTVRYFANCIWDALGVPAALGRDAVVHVADGHTRQPTRLDVTAGVVSGRGFAHFAVPAAHWWDDIVHT